MKKIFLIAALLLIMTVPAIAAVGVEATGNLSIGGTDTTDVLTCGLSSNVYALYDNDGATRTQWYVIGTYHLGGTEVYATAQDITSLYKLTDGKNPGDQFTWTGLPADSSASSSWSGDVWEQL